MDERFVILTWHSVNVHDDTHAGNDLVAFGEDLERLDALGWTVLPLADAIAGLNDGDLPRRTAVLTLDDGPVMDFRAFDHPSCGPQVGAFERLQRFSQTADPRHVPHVSSFAIASPEARAELDRVDYMGLGVWPDDWWAEATRTGMMAVENHSWDHNHASLARTLQRENRRGDFKRIDSEDECRGEIDRASDYIERVAGRRPRFFAYPYGEASDFLRRDYLPRRGPEIGLSAALGCDPEPVTSDSDRWFLPRYMCGRDWSSADDLSRLLEDALG